MVANKYKDYLGHGERDLSPFANEDRRIVSGSQDG